MKLNLDNITSLILLTGALTAACSLGTVAATVEVTDDSLSGNAHWTNDNEYLINGRVFVEDGDTLTIDAGTVIKAKPGTGEEASALIIAPGGKIMANGTAEAPIIFTAEEDDVSDPTDLGSTDRGLWGGVIILGRATLNSPVGETPITDNVEGIPVNEPRGIFGGDNDDDNSGVFRYVSIRHGGSLIGANNEINGLTLGGVGRGTTIEFVEVFANKDDGFEFFGGTVGAKYLIAAFCGDDSYDYDQGFRGRGQFWFTIGDEEMDHGGEHDGDIDDFTKEPLSNPAIYNATYIGPGTDIGSASLRIRENAAGQYYNSVFTQWGAEALRIDDTSAGQVENGNLDIADNIFFDYGVGSTAEVLATAPGQVFFTDASKNNQVVDPQLRGISRDTDGGLDPRPSEGSPALSAGRAVPQDGFFTNVGFKGAFGGVNWGAPWSFLAQGGILTMDGAGDPTQNEIIPFQLTVQSADGNLKVQLPTQSGVRYQYQTTIDFTSWSNHGEVIVGDGTIHEQNFNLTELPYQFVRILVNP